MEQVEARSWIYFVVMEDTEGICVIPKEAKERLNVHPACPHTMFCHFLTSFQSLFYLSGSEVGINIMLPKIGFHLGLSAGLGGQPADHMELLGLQTLQTSV